LYKDTADIYIYSMQIARMTHWDPEAGLTCFLYCLLAREFLNGATEKKETWEKAKKVFLEVTPHQFQGMAQILLDNFSDIENWPEDRLIPSGYTVDTLACTLWCFFNRDSFEDTVVAAVNLGGDADTVGAVVGGLAGVYWGFEAIPKRWIEKFSPGQVARLDRLAEGLGKVAIM
ncbi:MAG: ADP-ribosylglycohydrolase family protein, partial [Mobilitalea sp.]